LLYFSNLNNYFRSNGSAETEMLRNGCLSFHWSLALLWCNF